MNAPTRNIFDWLKELLDRAAPNQVLRFDLNEWYKANLWIAGFTKENPGKNLEAWLKHQGHRAMLNDREGFIEILTKPDTKSVS
jgi:hypothetical protein